MDAPAPDPANAHPLLNIYVFEDDGKERYFVCFAEPGLAGSRGIDPRSVVGDFRPGPDGGFDPATFNLNPGFVEAFVGYMNDEGARTPDLLAEAARNPEGYLYILDARFSGGPGVEPEASDLLGCYAVDGAGRIVPDSFQYNENHAMFGPGDAVSAVLNDRRFYDWLHAEEPDEPA